MGVRLNQNDEPPDFTWEELLEQILEKGFGENEYFEYGGISHIENREIEESLVWSEEVTGVAVYCVGAAEKEWYVHVDPTHAKGMDRYGSLKRGLIGKFHGFEKAMEAVKFITGKVYGIEEGMAQDTGESSAHPEQASNPEISEEKEESD